MAEKETHIEMKASKSNSLIRSVLVGMGVVVISGAGSPARQLEPYSETIAGTMVSFDMMPVPGAAVTITGPRAPGSERVVEVAPFWMGKTEVT